MRSTGWAFVASAFVLGACAGGEKKTGADTTAMAAPAATNADTAAMAPVGGAAPAGGATGTATPATGKTVTVQMVNDASGTKPRFVPQNVTIKSGDAIKWVFGKGIGPHNVAFDSAKAPADVKAKLQASMPNQMQPLMSQFMQKEGDSYTVSFGGIKPGTYYYYCLPHVVAGMKGNVIVQ